MEEDQMIMRANPLFSYAYRACEILEPIKFS